MQQPTLLSIIIPTYNEAEYLPTLLDCLHKQTWKNFEVIIADNNSIDFTRKLAENFGAKVVKGGWPGVARNQGSKHTNASLILFLDADVTIDINFLARTLIEFDQLNLDLANFRFGFPWPNLLAAFVYQLWNLVQPLTLKRKSKWASGAGILIKRSVFEKLGGFNETLRYGEDVNLINRACAQRKRFGILSQTITPAPRRFNRHEFFPMLANYFRGYISNSKKII